MLKVTRVVLLLAIAAMLTAPMAAQENEKKKKRNKGKRQPQNPVMAMLKQIELSDDQKPQIEEIAKEFGPKLMALQKKNTEILTEEQVKARREVQAELRKKGTKGREAQKAVTDALKLTAEQKSQMESVQKERRALQQQVVAKLNEVLTDDQKAKVPALKRGKGRKTSDKRKGKKKKKKEDNDE